MNTTEQTSIRFTGTQINYYFLCRKKLWYFTKNIEMEHNSDAVYLGKLIHETSANAVTSAAACSPKRCRTPKSINVERSGFKLGLLYSRTLSPGWLSLKRSAIEGARKPRPIEACKMVAGKGL